MNREKILEFFIRFPIEPDLYRMFIEGVAETLVQVNMEYFARYGIPEVIDFTYEDPKAVSNAQLLETAPFLEQKGKATCITYCAYICAIWRMEGRDCRVIAEKQTDKLFHTLIEVVENGSIYATDVTALLQQGMSPSTELRNAHELYYESQVMAGKHCCTDCARLEVKAPCSNCVLTGCCI